MANEKASSISDFKVALVLLGVALYLLFHTLDFPMSGTYAGVENQWYVSPALFPLMVLSLLTLCAAIMLIKAIVNSGYQAFFEVKTWLGDWQEQRVRDRWFVIFLLLVYVYVLVPSVDFYLSTVCFLLSLIARFYCPINKSLVWISLVNIALVLTIFYFKQQYVIEDEFTLFSILQDDNLIYLTDLSTAIAILGLAILLVLQHQATLKKAVTGLMVAVFMPLVLVSIFNYLLYVPMPVEYGTVIGWLDYLVYDVIMQ